MACSSNSIIQIQRSVTLMTFNSEYDVFVSFRGIDTRYNFTDNLFAAFHRKGITPFREQPGVNCKWLAAGSRVIIISRDAHIFKEYGVDVVYKVPLLTRMRHLRLLILEGVDFSGSLNYLSNELRYIEWQKYPFMYLPSSFQPNKIVELHLVNSRIKQLWEGTKVRQYKFFWRSVVLCLFNCPELTEIDSSTIFSWMIRIIKANQQISSPALFRRVDIVIPGREIPRWFNNKIVGESSINIDPWTIMHYHNIFGVAFCAVFSAAPIYQRYVRESFRKPVSCLCFWGGKWERVADIPARLDVIEVEGKYIWLAYYPRESFCDLLNNIDKNTSGNIVKMEFLVRKGMKVMSCGYHWVSQQDLQQLNGIMMNQGSISEK